MKEQYNLDFGRLLSYLSQIRENSMAAVGGVYEKIPDPSDFYSAIEEALRKESDGLSIAGLSFSFALLYLVSLDHQMNLSNSGYFPLKIGAVGYILGKSISLISAGIGPRLDKDKKTK